MARDLDESDCLELVSIGALCSGPWAKKYWSSSRGRDRYPYPIGYHALRIHSGVTYKMEIYEGSQGPIFQVNSSDGHVGSGRTPNLACDDFQKKSSSHIKMWHAKRFSCKVDGVEFFGFKNALVQRLLRELMTHVNGSSEPSLPSTSLCDEHVTKEHDSPSPQRCKYPNVVPYSSKSKIAKKRSRDHEFINPEAARLSEAFQPYQTSSAKLSFTEGIDQNNEEKPGRTSVCTEEFGVGCNVAVSSGNFEPCIELPVLDDRLLSKSNNICTHSDRKSCFTQQNQPFSFVASHLASIPVHHELSGERNLPVMSESLRVQQPISSIAIEQGFEESLIVNDSEGSVDSKFGKNSLLFAPDTLDTQEENKILHDSPSIREYREIKEDTAGADSLLSKGPVGWESQEKQVSMSGSYNSPGVDAVGEEVVKSMMKILLPKALPLLTYQSRRKKKKLNAFTGALSKPKPEDEMLSENSKLNQQESHHPVRDSGMDASGTKVYTGPNSSDNNLCQSNAAHEMQPFHDVAKVVEPDLGNIMSSLDPGKMQFHVRASKDLSSSVGQTYMRRQTDLNIPTVVHHSSSPSFERPVSVECNKDGFQESDLVSVPMQASRVLNPEAHSGTNNFILGGSEVPEKDHSSIEIVYANFDSSFPRSSTASPRINYDRHLSESILCRSIEEESLVAPGCIYALPGVQDSERASTSFASYHGKATHDVLDGSEQKTMIHDTFECPIKHIGCYSHPTQISSVITTRIVDDIYLCVSCHAREENRRNLFLYKLPVKQPNPGSPSFLGHIALTLPILKDTHGQEVSVERTGLQFTPDARGIILLNSIEFPHCRKEKHRCSCSTCHPHCLQENGLKIVQVSFGYASLVVKLKTATPVHFLLVCEPNHLVALDESGVLYLWVMNPDWSAPMEDYVMSSYDYVASRIVDLKKVPQCASLVVGHNGCGDFSLWDIVKRTVVSRFSDPMSSIFDFHPISLFSSDTKDLFECKRDGVICKATVTEAIKKGLSAYRNRTSFLSVGENPAVWLLVRTASDSSAEPSSQLSSCRKSSICWKLGLLVKDRVLLGATISRSCAITVSAGHGIMGTNEGLVHIWELLGGTMVKIINDFEGTAISHIATDDSVVAIAGEDAKLRVYLIC